ncbi:MAG: XRE family transcriptional regulator [Leptolyngbya foveolarum]|uniref:XRE family transcriptional regulator n=1 Tax=Leptolyngbya foveolarum TaxID=47253 RepID=A0A2W4TWD0_9CYAN|nr:MAG: XRE family transcriptional regulator [Leptolyngbya foveolarum]
MAVRNKIKEFVESQGMSVYAFREKTGIANKTAYDLVNTPSQIPSGNVISKICDAFEVQPNEILEWVPNAGKGKAA